MKTFESLSKFTYFVMTFMNVGCGQEDTQTKKNSLNFLANFITYSYI